MVDPPTGQPFSDNRIPQSRIDPAAQTLLAFIPLPNILGDTQNFHYVTANSSNSNDVNVRVTHVFGAQPQRGAGGGRGRGGFRPGVAGRPWRARRVRPDSIRAAAGPGPLPTRSVLNASLGFRRVLVDELDDLPDDRRFARYGGVEPSRQLAAHQGSHREHAERDLQPQQLDEHEPLRVQHEHCGAAGIDGVSSDPFDWGIPSLSFTTVADLRDRTPSRRVDQRIQISNSTMRTLGQHALRFGGEFRYLRLDSLSNSNPRGSFVFTGLYTSALANGRAVPGTGLDLADFLLGYAQQASVQYGPGDLKMRGRDWSLFLQDDWRLRGNLTLNYGLRYEYVSPYYEAQRPSGQPRCELGLHRRRAGRGRRDGGVHRRRADESRRSGQQQPRAAGRAGLAGAPGHDGSRRVRHQLQPRGVRDHRAEARGAAAVCGHLHQPGNGGRAASARRPVRTVDSATTTNSYGIDRTYDLGVAQIWNADVQRDLPRNLTVSLGYTGTKGIEPRHPARAQPQS